MYPGKVMGERLSNMRKRNHVLVVSSYDASYVVRDIESIQRYFPTKVIIGHGAKRSIIQIINLVTQILKGLIWSDVSFIWFADFRALLTVIFAKILKKKTIVVIGGYEVAHVPDISYGGTLNTFLKKKISWIIHHADVVLSVSNASRNELIQNYGYKKSILVYNGVEIEKFYVNSHTPKEDIVITVGGVTLSNLNRKGIETFVKAAAYLPEITFYVIGKADEAAFEHLQKIATKNVVLVGFASDEELIRFYHKAKVYVQVSCHEAFGVSLAEAMLCECVPVVTKKGSLPEVVDNTGFYVPYNNPEETAKAIQNALKSDKGHLARDHIMQNFAMKRREHAIVSIIQQTV